MHILSRIAFALLLAGFSAGASHAQGFPSKPVTIVVPFEAGGPTDNVARIVARAMEHLTGQSFIIENVGGAGSTIGAARVASAPPDGYTLLLASSSSMVIAPHLYATLRYEGYHSFAPIGLITEAPFILLVNSASPFTSYASLVEFGKAKPGELNFGTPGAGTTHHLDFEMLLSASDFKAVHVPFRGAAPMMTAILGGNIHVVLDVPNTALPLVQDGRLRPLAVTGSTRVPGFLDVPTFEELGIHKVGSPWFSLVAPKRTPESILSILQALLDKALKDREIIDALSASGFEAKPIGPAALQIKMEQEFETYGQIIKDRNLRTK